MTSESRDGGDDSDGSDGSGGSGGSESSGLTTAALNGLGLDGLDSGLTARLGIVFLEASPARLVATMPVEGNTQPYGLLHGGASVALAETLGSVGAALHAGPGRTAVGIEINATHHRSARTGLVTGTATALHLGRTLASYAVEVRDDRGQLLCSSRLSALLR